MIFHIKKYFFGLYKPTYICAKIKSMIIRMTTAEYAAKCGITQQAVHKRLKDIKKYPEIRKIEVVSKKLFFLKVNTDKGFTKIATNLQK